MKSSFWNFVLIIFFALAVVVIGADELHQRFSPGAKGKGSKKPKFTERFFGNQGLVTGGKSQNSKTRNEPKSVKSSFFRQDGLERSDKRELANLLDEVSK